MSKRSRRCRKQELGFHYAFIKACHQVTIDALTAHCAELHAASCRRIAEFEADKAEMLALLPQLADAIDGLLRGDAIGAPQLGHHARNLAAKYAAAAAEANAEARIGQADRELVAKHAAAAAAAAAATAATAAT